MDINKFANSCKESFVRLARKFGARVCNKDIVDDYNRTHDNLTIYSVRVETFFRDAFDKV